MTPGGLLKRYNAYREVFLESEMKPAGLWARFVLAVAAALLPPEAPYRLLFRGVFVRTVMADLQTFCRAYTSTFDPEREKVVFVLEGRREVYNRIVNYTNMNARFLRDLRQEAEEDA